jgi:hypothetical protein
MALVMWCFLTRERHSLLVEFTKPLDRQEIGLDVVELLNTPHKPLETRASSLGVYILLIEKIGTSH